MSGASVCVCVTFSTVLFSLQLLLLRHAERDRGAMILRTHVRACKIHCLYKLPEKYPMCIIIHIPCIFIIRRDVSAALCFCVCVCVCDVMCVRHLEHCTHTHTHTEDIIHGFVLLFQAAAVVAIQMQMHTDSFSMCVCAPNANRITFLHTYTHK